LNGQILFMLREALRGEERSVDSRGATETRLAPGDRNGRRKRSRAGIAV